MRNITGKKNPNFKTGACIGGRPGWYNSWQNMKARCLNASHPKYANYGGRGITICEEWLGAEKFKEWAESSGWSEGKSIDRINNNGNYSPENCQWVSVSENSRKKSTTKITFDQAKEIRSKLDHGIKRTELAREYNVSDGTIWFIQHRITHVADGECSRKLKEMRML